MPNSNWKVTPLSKRLGIQYPLIQGPLGGLSSQRLTAAVSNFGGLGSFGAHGLKPAAITQVIREIRGLTAKPFAMNLWVSMEDAGAFDVNAAAFNQSLAPLLPHIERFGGTAPVYAAYAPIRFEDQVQVLLDAKVPVISFICGIPSPAILAQCQARGICTLGTATTPEEAVALESAGLDGVVASGFEAGGHRGAFLRSAEQSLFGTFSLVPQVVDAVRIPVVAAGGISDARGVMAALALGADGVQMGTAFLACAESGASPYQRALLRAGKASHTALTRGFTGRLARGIRNRLIDEFESPDYPILPYPLQRALVKHLTGPAEAAGATDFMQMWAGQSANLARGDDLAHFLQSLTAQIAHLHGES